MCGWWCNNHLEKYEFVNGKDDIPYMMENKKQCLKPSTRPVSVSLILTPTFHNCSPSQHGIFMADKYDAAKTMSTENVLQDTMKLVCLSEQ